MITIISNFRGQYYFLSNFYSSPITYNGRTYTNNEAAFQACKCPDRVDEFISLSPQQAKKIGRSVELRSDWEKIKDQAMYEICKAKFKQNSILKRRLIQTGNEILQEDNYWHDTYWGKCNGQGQNKLGEILMRVREELRH